MTTTEQTKHPLLVELIENLRTRASYLRKDRNTHTWFLKDVDPEPLVYNSFGHIVKGLERKASLIDICVTIGRRVLQKLKRERSSIASCQVGWFILCSYFEVNLLDFSREQFTKKNGRKSKFLTYSLVVKNRKALFELWDEINTLEVPVDIFPSTAPMAPWTTGIHPSGNSLIKKGDSDLLKQLTPEQQPVIFEALNKLGRTGLRINPFLLDVLNYWIEQPDGPENPVPYKRETENDKKASLRIVADSIAKLGNKHRDNVFYDLYNVDFRGRLYSNTAFLNFQADDIAKALIMHDEGSRLGEEGLFYLYLHLSNVWGFDKAPLEERVQFTIDHYEEWLGYAEDPNNNLGWTKADKAWSFLAGCFELKLLNDWIAAGYAAEDFVTNYIVYIDGSNNGR